MTECKPLVFGAEKAKEKAARAHTRPLFRRPNLIGGVTVIPPRPSAALPAWRETGASQCPLLSSISAVSVSEPTQRIPHNVCNAELKSGRV